MKPLLLAIALIVTQANADWVEDNQGKAKVWQSSLDRRRTVKWSGGIDSEGYALGQGTLTVYYDRKTVATYEGKMLGGRMDGHVVANYIKTKQRYVGELREWNENGLGTMWYADGSTKEGFWRDSQFIEARRVAPLESNEPANPPQPSLPKDALLPSELPVNRQKDVASTGAPESNSVVVDQVAVPRVAEGAPSVRDYADASLEELLKADGGKITKAKPEENPLWLKLLSALERQDFQAALMVAQDVEASKDFLEPFQRTFATTVIDVVIPRGKVTSGGGLLVANQRKIIEDANDEVSKSEQEIRELEAGRPAIQKRISNNLTGAKIGGLLLKEVAEGIAGSNIANAERELAELDRAINLRKQKIESARQREKQSQNEIQRMTNEGAMAAVDRAEAQRKRVRGVLVQLKERGQFQPTILLATAYIRNVSEDEIVNRIAQECIDLGRRQSQALSLAAAALKPVNTAIENRRFWTAKGELTRAIKLINQRVSDRYQLELLSTELGTVETDIETRIEQANEQRETFLEIASRDAVEGSKRFKAFQVSYPDYPNVERDELRIQDFRQAQVQAKYERTLAAIDEVIPNDPAEAKVMMRRLVGEVTSPDEISILKAKITALEGKVWDSQFGLLQERVNDVHFHLRLYNAAYAKSIASGNAPSFSMPLRMENLQQARSLLSGLILELNLLLKEEIPSANKRRFVGLLEGQKISLAQIDSTLWLNKLTLIASICGVGLICILVVFYIFKLKKRKRSSQPQ